MGGRVNRFIPNPTFDPVGKPGALDEYFRGRNPRGADLNALFGDLEPIPPAYRDRDARLAAMDEQGMAGCILLPTLGVGMEQALLPDLDATVATFRAFNRWMDDDWGFAYQERIFGAPYITLCKPDEAVRELEWALERDARFVVMIPGPITTEVGMRAPGDPMFDAFWQLANDSGVTVCYHSGETYYSKFMPAWGESDYMMSFQALLGFRSLFSGDAIQDTFANHLHKGLFLRFPNLRMACIESGSTWVFHLFEKLTRSFGQIPQIYQGRPAGNLQTPRVGVALLRGRAGQPVETVGRQADHYGFGLPPRRRPGRARVLHQGPGELRLHPGAVSNCHARQRTPALDPSAGVKADKSNVVAMLLEVGEENAAVLLSRSALPDELDLDSDLDARSHSDWTAIRSTKWRGLTIGALGRERKRPPSAGRDGKDHLAAVR